MPSYNHGRVQSKLIGEFLPHKEYDITCELTLEVPNRTWLTPDISVYPHRPAKWSRDDLRMTTMPKLVVEILSPTQGWQEMMDKLTLYFAQRVESAWVVQPGPNIVAIYQSTALPPLVFTQGEAKDPATGLTARLEEVSPDPLTRGTP